MYHDCVCALLSPSIISANWYGRHTIMDCLLQLRNGWCHKLIKAITAAVRNSEVGTTLVLINIEA
jgi:hypothetical protein